VIGGVDGPFSGKLTLLGDDGKKREVTYKNGQVVARTEWHENGAVKVVSEFSHGVEIKRTGWRDDNKWFEIEFTVDEAPTGHGKPTPPPVPPLIPGKHGATDAHGTLDKHGANGAHNTSVSGSTVKSEATKPKHKWPAFVPGSPNFSPVKTPISAGHVSAQSNEAAHSGDDSAASGAHDTPVPDVSYEQLRKRLLADGQKLPVGATEIIADIVKSKAASVPTPIIKPVPKSVGPAAELRADHLVYVLGSSLPYTGNTTLFDENNNKTYEGDFQEGRKQGKGVEWYAKGYGIGKRKFEGEFKDDRYYEGDLYWYYTNGRKKLRIEYSEGLVVKAYMWNREGKLRWGP
jgi:hypothetical protein